MNLLLITGKMHPNPSANSIIIQYLMDELIERGHKIRIISLYQEDDKIKSSEKYGPIYSIKMTFYAKYIQKFKEDQISAGEKVILSVLFFLRRIKNVLNIWRFPDVDPGQSKKGYLLAKKLHTEEPFEAVIGVFRPFSAISSLIKLKKDFPDLIAGAYYLDLISGSNKPNLIPQTIYNHLCISGERRAFRNLDFVLMAKEGENIYKDAIYSPFNHNIEYVDFPMFVNVNDFNIKRCNSDKEIVFVYAGTLDKNYRNPTYMLELLSKIGNKIPNLTLHIYGKGDCGSIINDYCNEDKISIIQHGFVGHDEVIFAMKSSDFIINIANTTENIVPSKIFELFSVGKPIINFVKNQRDSSLMYFNKYPSVNNVREWNDIEEQIDETYKFIMNEKGNEYSFEQIKNNFIENTPRYVVEKIENIIMNLSKHD